MKKIASSIISIFTVFNVLLLPVAVHAQDSTPIVIDDTTALPTTGATPETPASGIAPPNNKLVQNIVVFSGGGMLGALLGLGIVSYRKKQNES